MNNSKYLAVAAALAVGLPACGNGEIEQAPIETQATTARDSVATKLESAAGHDGTVANTGSPYNISYRIVGTPIVGSPVTIALRVESAVGRRPLTLQYRINDASAMIFAEAQLASVSLEPVADEDFVMQQVTVVPQREGRSYLNVSASSDTGEGTLSTVAAIPIQISSSSR
jgi:hypothetical protein